MYGRKLQNHHFQRRCMVAALNKQAPHMATLEAASLLPGQARAAPSGVVSST